MVVAAAGITSASAAEEASNSDALAWLKKIASASRQTNYTGTFVYHQGNQVGSLRIAHYVDAGGEHERLETLDGPSREIVRDNDRVSCYLADSKTVLVEQRWTPRFPTPLPIVGHVADIIENYNVRKGEQSRVAGMDCQVIVLEPKDNLRYGRRFCAEMTTGLPLLARTLNDRNEAVELLAFTQIHINDGAAKDSVKSRFAKKSQDWRIDRSGLVEDRSASEIGWELKTPVHGFRKVVEMRRSLPGGAGSMSQIVYSDGLAAVSAFIEPLPRNAPGAGAANHGAVNIFMKLHADRMVTVIGEAPARTVKQVADMLAPKNK
jgi:sigma-E factor negative regulatory protein RseB